MASPFDNQSGGITLKVVGDKKLQRTIRFLKDDLFRRMAAEALTKTAFDVRDAEAQHVKSIFDFASTTTQQFFTSNRGLRVWHARASQNPIESIIYPGPKTESILKEHLSRQQLKKKKHLLLPAADRPRNNPGPAKLAIPLGVKRNKRGKVPADQTPSRLLGKFIKSGTEGGSNRSGGRSFLVGIGGGKELLVQRKRRSSRDTKGSARYLLVPTASNPPSFKWLAVAELAARRNFERQFRRAYKKIVAGYPGFRKFGF